MKRFLASTAAAAVIGLLFPAGCADTAGTSTKVNYRTIRAEPLRDTETAQRISRKGLEHLRAGRLEDAADAFKRAIEADVTHGPAHNNLGKVHLRRFEYNAARLEFEAAIELMPTHAAPRNNLALALERAWVADRQLSSLDAAVESYRKAVELDPRQVEYCANLARALVRRGDRTDELARLLERILEEDTRPEWLAWARRQLTRMPALAP